MFPSGDKGRALAIKLKEGTIVWLKVWRMGWLNWVWGAFEFFIWTREIETR
jgi:hypothetical protein